MEIINSSPYKGWCEFCSDQITHSIGFNFGNEDVEICAHCFMKLVSKLEEGKSYGFYQVRKILEEGN
jgi:hypothetical protein